MGLQVVGAGLGRTGTMSLKLALEQLLDGRCYHMFETFDASRRRPGVGRGITGRHARLEHVPRRVRRDRRLARMRLLGGDVGRQPGCARPALGARERRCVVEERRRHDLPGVAAHAGAERRGALAGRLLRVPVRDVPRRGRGQGLLRRAQRAGRAPPRAPIAWSSTSRAAGGSRCAPRSVSPYPTRRSRTRTPPRSSSSASRQGLESGDEA